MQFSKFSENFNLCCCLSSNCQWQGVLSRKCYFLMEITLRSFFYRMGKVFLCTNSFSKKLLLWRYFIRSAILLRFCWFFYLPSPGLVSKAGWNRQKSCCTKRVTVKVRKTMESQLHFQIWKEKEIQDRIKWYWEKWKWKWMEGLILALAVKNEIHCSLG